MATKEKEAGGAGEAQDAEVATAPADEEETQEEHDAAIRAKLTEAADAVMASAEAALDKAKEALEAAEASMKKAEAHRASLEE